MNYRRKQARETQQAQQQMFTVPLQLSGVNYPKMILLIPFHKSPNLGAFVDLCSVFSGLGNFSGGELVYKGR
eukprot:4505880-Amphidinium_carterae.1